MSSVENHAHPLADQSDSSSSEQTRRTAAGRAHSPSRERVLREVELRGSTTVAELAQSASLHENTVRGHLSGLQADGYVRQVLSETSGRGRPSHRWEAVPPEAQHPYAGLAATLANALASTGPRASHIARAAGTAWGATLALQSDAGITSESILTSAMREQGFDPHELTEPVGDGSSEQPRQIVLRQCPLLAAAHGRTEVVCAVHEGMIEGLMRASSPDARAELLPFAADGACLLHIQAAHQAA